MFKVLMALMLFAATTAAAEANSTKSKNKAQAARAGASFLGATSVGDPRYLASFRGDPDKARFKSAVTFYRGYEVERY